jgi:hypothetical protein
LREKLAAVLIIPSSWGSQLDGDLHQHTVPHHHSFRFAKHSSFSSFYLFSSFFVAYTHKIQKIVALLLRKYG